MSITLLNLKSTSEDDEVDGSGAEKYDIEYRPLRNGSSSSFLELGPDTKSISSDQEFSLHQAASDGSIDLVKLFLNEIRASGHSQEFEDERDRFNTQGLSPLHLAARYNRKNVVSYLLEVGAKIDEKDGEDENTPLLLATKYDMKLTAKFLISKGASPLIKNKYGTTPLHFAARRGNAEICGLLLKLPFNNIVHATDNGQATPLHMAMLSGNEDVTKLLISSGANVNAEDIEGERPIHFAAAEDGGDLIVLLTKGALKGVKLADREKVQRDFVNALSFENDTALHIAAQAGYEETVKTLVSIGANVNMKTDTQQTPLHLAAISGQTTVIRFLVMHSNARISVRDSDLMTPLHRACQYGRLDAIKFLRGRGARLEVKDKDNFTPLMCAVWKGQNPAVEYLLEEGANIEALDTSGKCVLHLAIEEGYYETLELLLQKGGDKLLNNPDKDYRTPLHFAAQIGDYKSMTFLLNNRAVLDVGDHEEKTALHAAAEQGHLECVQIIGKAAPGIINATDDRGKSPLHHAAINGHVAVTECLIEMGGETSCRDDVNWTPLDYAARNDWPKTMLVLLDNDAPVDAYDSNYTSPLHHASIQGHTNCISILLDNNASILLRNIDGKNCLDLAVENFQIDACRTIINHKRWLEAVRRPDNAGVHPMEKIIEVAPDVATMVLDKCVEVTKDVPRDSVEYYEKYNFELLDIHPDHQSGDLYFGPATMVLYERDELLSHPLTVRLLKDKWERMGRWVYMCSLFVYLLFVAFLTTLVVLEKNHARDSNISSCDTTRFSNVVSWLTFAVACFQILKELVQAIYLGRKYLFDPVNWFEFLLYSSTFLFMIPFIKCQFQDEISQVLTDMKWQAGSISILFAWFNLLLYLKRLPIFGLYVVMFTEIFWTLINVLLVFSMLIIGFSLSFYALVDVQNDFKMPGSAFVRTSVMMVGELEYDGLFTENTVEPKPNSTTCIPGDPSKNCLPHKQMTYFVFLLFIVVMTIVVTNLLVGLAVGDIESVRKNAYLRILKSQVRIIQVFERTYPKFIRRRIYKPQLLVEPKKRSRFQRFMDWLEKKSTEALKDEQVTVGGTEEKLLREINAQREELLKQKEKMKSLLSMIEEHVGRTKKIARKLNVTDLD